MGRKIFRDLVREQNDGDSAVAKQPLKIAASVRPLRRRSDTRSQPDRAPAVGLKQILKGMTNTTKRKRSHPCRRPHIFISMTLEELVTKSPHPPTEPADGYKKISSLLPNEVKGSQPNQIYCRRTGQRCIHRSREHRTREVGTSSLGSVPTRPGYQIAHPNIANFQQWSTANIYQSIRLGSKAIGQDLLTRCAKSVNMVASRRLLFLAANFLHSSDDRMAPQEHHVRPKAWRQDIADPSDKQRSQNRLDR
ncbi:hypothetical protein VDGL01_06087 [Verticillium dahliae]